MDILSCLVGVMLFLVIYTVLELGSTSFEVSVPTPKDRPAGSERIVVIVNDHAVRLMDTGQPVLDLLANVAGVPLLEVPDRVRQANLSPPTDAHFSYRLDLLEEASVLDPTVREYDVIVDQLPGEVGDSMQHLDGSSRFEMTLSDLDPESNWIDFAVDSQSVDVFRRARDIAESLGFATRWGPLDLSFPTRYSLRDDPGGPSARNSRSKPQR